MLLIPVCPPILSLDKATHDDLAAVDRGQGISVGWQPFKAIHEQEIFSLLWRLCVFEITGAHSFDHQKYELK